MTGEFILDATAGDLPDVRPAAALANQDFVDERVMHIARQDDVIARGSGMTKDVQNHVGGTTVRHPVLRIDQQRVATPAEYTLYRLDQLDAEHGGR